MPPSLSSIVCSALRAVRKHGVVGAWRIAKQRNLRCMYSQRQGHAGLVMALLRRVGHRSGRVALLKVDGAVLKGVDSAGNKYWEKMQDQHGRKRDLSIPPLSTSCFSFGLWWIHTGPEVAERALGHKIMIKPGRHRWVEYASAVNYDAAQVPPEWHGWLHHITDHTPEQLTGLKPTRYGLEAWGKVPKYMAKGYALHPRRRMWQRFEAWQEIAHVETEQSGAVASSVQGPAPPQMRFIPEPPGVKLCNDVPERVVEPVEKVRKETLKTNVTKSDDCFGL